MSGILTSVAAGVGIGGTAGAIVGSTIFGAAASERAAGKAAESSLQASETQAAGQQAGLDYLRETEAVPQAYREQALGRLGSLYGLPGLEGEAGDPMAGKREFVEGLKEDPFYQELLQSGEESVLRGAGATGMLRSGSTQAALAEVAPDILQQIYGEQVAGLSGMAQLPSAAREIARQTGAVGATRAGGILAAGQAEQYGLEGMATAIGSGTGQYLKWKAGI